MDFEAKKNQALTRKSIPKFPKNPPENLGIHSVTKLTAWGYRFCINSPLFFFFLSDFKEKEKEKRGEEQENRHGKNRTDLGKKKTDLGIWRAGLGIEKQAKARKRWDCGEASPKIPTFLNLCPLARMPSGAPAPVFAYVFLFSVAVALALEDRARQVEPEPAAVEQGTPMPGVARVGRRRDACIGSSPYGRLQIASPPEPPHRRDVRRRIGGGSMDHGNP